MYPIWKIFWVEVKKRHKFFPHVGLFIGPFLQKISAKIHFFRFLKTSQNTYLTRILNTNSRILYREMWFSGFGFKMKIAIFSTYQNTIWTRFEWFWGVWKCCIFTDFSCFFTTFLDFSALLSSLHFHTFPGYWGRINYWFFC